MQLTAGIGEDAVEDILSFVGVDAEKRVGYTCKEEDDENAGPHGGAIATTLLNPLSKAAISCK